MSTLFAVLSDHNPMLVLVEDAHAADTQSAELLEHLLRKQPAGDILFLATARSGHNEHTDGYRALRDELQPLAPRAELRRLGGLGVPAAAQLLGQRAGVEYQAVPRDVARRLVQRTAGNPLYMRSFLDGLSAPDVARTLRGDGLLWSDRPIELPGVFVSEAERASLRMSTEAVLFVRAAAVVGMHFDAMRVCRVAQLDPANVDRWLWECRRQSIIEPVADGPGRYRFSHQLVHDAIHRQVIDPDPKKHRAGDDLPDGRTLHLRAADDLRLGGDEAAERISGPLSFHLLQAGQYVDARRFALIAAEQATASSSFGLAVTHLERAVDASVSLGDVVALPKLLMEKARAQRKAGRQAATDTFTEAAARAKQLGDGATMADALCEAARRDWRRLGSVDTSFVDRIDDALELLPADHDVRRANLLCAKAVELTFAADEADAEMRRGCLAEALRLVPADSDPRARRRVLDAKYRALLNEDGLDDRLGVVAELEQLASRSGSVPQRFEVASLGYWVSAEAGHSRQRRAHLQSMAHLTSELDHQTTHRVFVHWKSVESAIVGEMAAAVEYANQAHDLGKVEGFVDAPVWSIGARFLPLRAAGRTDELIPELEHRLDVAPEWTTMLAGLALAHARAGRVADAARVFARTDLDRLVGPRAHQDQLVNMAVVAEALSYLQGHHWAEPLCKEMARREAEARIAFNGSACFGAVAYHRGLLLVSLGRLDEAAESFRSAVGVNRQAGVVVFLAESRIELASVLAELGAEAAHEHGASELVEAAQQTVDKHELVVLEERVEQVRDRVEHLPSGV